MKLETTRENITVNKFIEEKNDIVIIEEDIIVPDAKPDILNTIDACGTVCVYKKEVQDGKVKIDGSVCLNLLYLADTSEDFTRNLSTVLDFTQMINMEKCKYYMKIRDNISIKNIECKVLNGRKVKIKVTLNIKIVVYSNEEISILKNLENVKNIQTLKSNVKINSLVGSGNCKSVIKDNIHLDETDTLGEILNTKINIINKENKVSYNKVLLKADCNVEIMYLTEDKKLKTVTSIISIMGFIDINNISENNILESNYEIKNILVKPDIDTKKSIYVEIEFNIDCDVIDNVNIELIQDMYSLTDELEFVSKNLITESDKKNIKDIFNIQNNINMPEMKRETLYNVTAIPNILNVTILNGKIIYEGDIELRIIYQMDINRIETKKYNLPFTFEMINNEINSNVKVNTNINCIDNNFIIESDGIIKSKITLEFDVMMHNNIKLNIIDEVNIKSLDIKEFPSVIIYIAKSGDTIWNIAKKYKTTIEKIIDINNLENPDNLEVGEKLFIPRYNNLKTV